jgi:hypothetical protein
MLTTDYQEVTLPHGVMLCAVLDGMLIVGQFTGDRRGLPEIITYATANGCTAVRFLTFRKALIAMLHEEAALLSRWEMPEVVGYVLEIRTCLNS